MRVVHFSTAERSGGAARSARRLHDALLGSGVDSRMIVRFRQTDDPTVAQVDADRHQALLWATIEQRWIIDNRSDLTNTWFSSGRPGTQAAFHPWTAEADVLHVHWVPGLLASRDVKALLDLGKPVVWTLHDEWAFTGGCHFTAGCDQWRTACERCPQLTEDPDGLVEATFADKLLDYEGGRLLLVAPSRWLSERATQAAVFRGRPVETIAYGIDLSIYTPEGRAAGRAELGAKDDDQLLLFAAYDAAERRKGFGVLAEALAICSTDSRLRNLRLVMLGARSGAASAVDLPFPVVGSGLIHDERRVAATFAACDLFVIPSLEDNQPNTMLEALACGTPTVGSSAGGIPEVLTAQRFPAVVAPGDSRALARLLVETLTRPTELRSARIDARRLAEERFDFARYAARHRETYERVLSSNAS